MLSRSFLYAAAFFVVGSLFGASVYAFIAPAAEVEQPRSDASVPNAPAITPWSQYLSGDAVDSAGIEANLDGNASAL